MAPRTAQDGLTTDGRVGRGGEGGHKGRPYRRRVSRGWVLDGVGRVWDAAHYARVGRGWARREEGERTVGWGGAGSNGERRYARPAGCWWVPAEDAGMTGGACSPRTDAGDDGVLVWVWPGRGRVRDPTSTKAWRRGVPWGVGRSDRCMTVGAVLLFGYGHDV